MSIQNSMSSRYKVNEYHHPMAKHLELPHQIPVQLPRGENHKTQVTIHTSKEDKQRKDSII